MSEHFPGENETATVVRSSIANLEKPSRFVLEVTQGPDRGASLVLDGSEPGRLLLGTSEACSLRLTDPSVSRRHLALEPIGGGVVVEARTTASQEVGTITIGTYASDVLYQATVPELKLERNCYMNESGPLHFALFAANGGNYGALGAQYDFPAWKAKGFDVDSVESAPGFTSASEGNFELASTSPCAKMGAYAKP